MKMKRKERKRDFSSGTSVPICMHAPATSTFFHRFRPSAQKSLILFVVTDTFDPRYFLIGILPSFDIEYECENQNLLLLK